MVVVGLTGGIGSGKTTVAGQFKKLGAHIIDADKIAREMLQPQTSLGKKVINCFGQQILYKTKKKSYINRKKLAAIVFSDKEKLKKLNELMHPSIINQIKKEIREVKQKKGFRKQIIIVDAPLLFETGVNIFMDKVIVVSVSREYQIERMKKRDGLNKKDSLRIIKNQWPLGKKTKCADYLIDNSESIQRLKERIENVWEELLYLK
ncbi:dephospho-CoA kinase [bacterium]|nr:dephospho-CoA kinase [bacterium]